MSDKRNHDPLLSAAECADRLGLTVRALRVYEDRGLIAPRRTEKNWRLYGAAEIARLTEILALKRLGLSLTRITVLLAGAAPDLGQTLTIQQSALVDLRDRVEHSLSLIGAALQKISSGQAVSISELITLAKETRMTDLSPDTVAWRRYEQARPRTEVRFDPEKHGSVVGDFQFEAGDVLSVTRREDGLMAQLTGQNALEIYPEADDLFFYRIVQAQLSFTRNEQGEVEGVVLHQGGYEQAAKRIDETKARAVADDLEKRVKDKIPFPDSEALLRRVIAEHQRGEPDYEGMTPPLAAVAREQAPLAKAELDRLGSLQSVAFKGVLQEGWDVYDVRFEKGTLECGLMLAPGGKLSGIYFRPGL
ncbi:UNVERIFIED_ORG: DNA-binding transcriptional MerR regulator [Ensifer adhaerens]|nr:DNA-binding transcriptional MerR regulator [Ensifer adhaerens]